MSTQSDYSLTRDTDRRWATLLLTAGATPVGAVPTLLPPIRQNGFFYCFMGVVNIFNPKMVNSGVTADTLSAKLYDQLLAVDPYIYGLISELGARWEALDNSATYRFTFSQNIGFQRAAWFAPTRMLNANDVVISFAGMFDLYHPCHTFNGGDSPYFDCLQFLQTVQRIKRIYNDTIKFPLESPGVSFLSHLETHYEPVLSAEYADRLMANGHQEQLKRFLSRPGRLCSMNTSPDNLSVLRTMRTIGEESREWRRC